MTMTHRSLTRLGFPAIAALAATGACLSAGCGGSQGSEAPASATAPTGTNTAQAAAPSKSENKVLFQTPDYDTNVKTVVDDTQTPPAASTTASSKKSTTTAAADSTGSGSKGSDSKDGLPTVSMSEMMADMTPEQNAFMKGNDHARPLYMFGERLVKGHIHPDVTVQTNKGTFVIEVDPEKVQTNAGNFVALALNHFYDHLTFHRYEPGFVIQGGDPQGTGGGGPGYTIPNEDGPLLHDTGVVAMATAGPNTGGSQFYVTLAPHHELDHQYTVFGKVIKGMDVVQQLRQGDQIVKMTVSGLPKGFTIANPVVKTGQ